MKIHVQLDWKDYLDASRLHMRPVGARRVARWSVIGLVAAVFICTVLLWILGELTPEIVKSWSYLLPVVAAAVGLYLLSYYVYLPWNTRRIFLQQKEYAAPFEIEITPQALLAYSQYGYSNRPWADYRKWRQDEKLLLLYLSDVQYTVIPKRFLDDQQIEEIRAHLRENEVMDANRPNLSRSQRYLTWLPLALLLVAVLVALYLAFRQPIP